MELGVNQENYLENLQIHYIKLNQTLLVEKQIAKLSLNSTYSKFTQKEQEYSIKLASKEEVKEVISKYHVIYFKRDTQDVLVNLFTRR